MSSISLPENLDHIGKAKFDDLYDRGEIYYDPSDAEVVESDGFKLEFRICPALLKKKVLPCDAPERHGEGGPFINPDPDFVVAQVGEHHTLEMSMHCIYRPAYILHTRMWAPQTSDLDINDFKAGRALLLNLQRTAEQMLIYNCGVEAGASQGHKHMQIFAPETSFTVFPALAECSPGVVTHVRGTPHIHFVARLSENTTPDQVLATYQLLLNEVKTAHANCGGGTAYNVVMTVNWICLIPRRYARKHNTGANGAGMVGIVWLRDQAERVCWDKLGLSKHLAYLGIPAEDPKL